MEEADPPSGGPGPWWKSVAEPRTPVDLNIEVPHSARIYDYLLGGKDNFPADREAAKKSLALYPNGIIAARQNRAFMTRAVRYLAGEAGVRQFLDIGTGIPTSPNLHEIAQAIIPDSRVVYVDNDPIVLAHARALLTSGRRGRTAYLDADLRDPDGILASPGLRDTLDLTEPVALSLIAILPYVSDEEAPVIIGRLLDAFPSGSYLALTHNSIDLDPAMHDVVEVYRQGGIILRPRSRAEFQGLFAGLELIDPGVGVLHRWRPDDDTDADLTDAQVGMYGGIARKV